MLFKAVGSFKKFKKFVIPQDTIILIVGLTDKVVPHADTGVASTASASVKSIVFMKLLFDLSLSQLAA